MTDDTEAVEVGRVGRPHGLDGSFYVVSPEPDALTVGRQVTLNGRETVIERRAGTDAKPIARVSGHATRTAAEALRGVPLMMARKELPPLEAGEFWASDLIGCEVVDGERPVGRVGRLLGLPSCEVLEVVRSEGGDPLLVPLVADAVRNVDVQVRRVEVDLAFLGES